MFVLRIRGRLRVCAHLCLVFAGASTVCVCSYGTQTNFGGSLTVAGVPVEADLMELLRGAPAEAREVRR